MKAVSLIVSNVEASLDKVAPFHPMTFQPDKPMYRSRKSKEPDIVMA